MNFAPYSLADVIRKCGQHYRLRLSNSKSSKSNHGIIMRSNRKLFRLYVALVFIPLMLSVPAPGQEAKRKALSKIRIKNFGMVNESFYRGHSRKDKTTKAWRRSASDQCLTCGVTINLPKKRWLKRPA